MMNKKIDDLIGSEPSGWLKEAQWRRDNRAWLDRSFEIALQVLCNLRETNRDKKWLAEQIGMSPKEVGKMLNGKENFTLQSITKIETALGIQLIEIITEKHRQTTKP